MNQDSSTAPAVASAPSALSAPSAPSAPSARSVTAAPATPATPGPRSGAPKAPGEPAHRGEPGQRGQSGQAEGPGHPPGPDQPNEPAPGGDPQPLLVLPYDDLADNGARPLPASVISWLAPALRISVDGIPYAGGTLPRGRPTQVAVRVANWGDKDARALVTLYWADPTPLFSGASLRAAGLSDPVWVDVPRRGSTAPGLALAGPFLLTPPPAMPDHACLLAEITAGDAGAPGLLDPVANRHYAQHNVDIEHVKAGQTASLVFHINNPFQVGARVLVRVRGADPAMLATLERAYQAPAIALHQRAFGVQLVADAAGNGQRAELLVELAPGERRLCQGLVNSAGLAPGQFAAGEVEVLAAPLHQDRNTGEQRGSLGVVVFAR